MSKLFDDFQPVSAQEWKQKIQFDLKGGDYNQELVWTSAEGINIKPFYTSEDLSGSIYVPPRQSSFKISQRFFNFDKNKTIQSIKKGIENGLDHIQLFIPEDKASDLPEILKELDGDSVNILVDFEKPPKLGEQELKNLLGFDALSLSIDILGHFAEEGNWYYDLKTDHLILNSILKNCPKDLSVISIGIDLYQNAGANMVQQLAYGMAHINEYINHFDSDLLKAPPIFKVSVGTNFFFEIAKIRALRALWYTLATEFGLNSNCIILATPSRRYKTIYDYNTNMLRTTTECMSAISGGADIISNFPYDGLYHKSNEFGDRIARNQPLILKHESYFSAVNNQADGSYYIEALTASLANDALELFKDIEANGGLHFQLMSGTIQRKIRESNAKEQAKFNIGELVLLGSNKFPNPDDKMKNELELYPFVKTKKRKTLIEPIIPKRLSENYEKERLNNE